MNQPDYLTARVMALEDVQVHLETLDFARALCQETMAVKRQAPMQVSRHAMLPFSFAPLILSHSHI